MLRKKAGWLAAGFMFFAGSALAQVTAIQGTVKGPDGKPLANAMVHIQRLDIKGNYKVKTSKKGEYFHGGLPLGTYDVFLIMPDGKEIKMMGNVRTHIAEATKVDFDLKGEMDRQEALQRAAESGTMTKEQQKELSPEARAQLEKAAKERSAQMAKNKALNDAFNAGMLALNSKQYDQAVEAFNRALPIADTPANQKAVVSNLAEAYTQQAATKTGAEHDAALNSALEQYQKLIEMDPSSAGVHNNYALALARAKKFDQAQAELKKAAELDPPMGGKYYYNLGALLVNAGQYDPAADAFKKAIELTPNYAEAHYQYAVCLSSKLTTTADGKPVAPPGMREELQKYLELAPTGPNADAAKQLLASLESSVQTSYTNPNAPPPKKSKKK